jgi:ABC-type antimicrobial peptide transport system permease subunit
MSRERVQFKLRDALRLGVNYLIRRRDRSLLNVASIGLGLSFYTTLLLTDAFYQAYAARGGASIAVEQTYFWLVSVALAVSVIGITNAMLISVQERVKEIGTMKCIGAVEGHIVLLFMVEAVLQGLAGGAMGVVVGTLAALVTTGWTTGFLIVLAVPPLKLLTYYVGAMLIALSLSVAATVYPAYRASRLDAVEALRYEL